MRLRSCHWQRQSTASSPRGQDTAFPHTSMFVHEPLDLCVALRERSTMRGPPNPSVKGTGLRPAPYVERWAVQGGGMSRSGGSAQALGPCRTRRRCSVCATRFRPWPRPAVRGFVPGRRGGNSAWRKPVRHFRASGHALSSGGVAHSGFLARRGCGVVSVPAAQPGAQADAGCAFGLRGGAFPPAPLSSVVGLF
jgi:hypothetical protein